MKLFDLIYNRIIKDELWLIKLSNLFTTTNWIVVADEAEMNIGEIQSMYWALRANNITARVVAPVDIKKMFNIEFENPNQRLLVKVKKEDFAKAREMLMMYRADQRKPIKNIAI